MPETWYDKSNKISALYPSFWDRSAIDIVSKPLGNLIIPAITEISKICTLFNFIYVAANNCVPSILILDLSIITKTRCNQWSIIP